MYSKSIQITYSSTLDCIKSDTKIIPIILTNENEAEQALQSIKEHNEYCRNDETNNKICKLELSQKIWSVDDFTEMKNSFGFIFDKRDYDIYLEMINSGEPYDSAWSNMIRLFENGEQILFWTDWGQYKNNLINVELINCTEKMKENILNERESFKDAKLPSFHSLYLKDLI